MKEKDSTIEYYNANAEKFTEGTFDLVFTVNQDKFLHKLPKQASILDFGCGSGRDTKYFLEKGYAVTATDGSAEMVKTAQKNVSCSVKLLLFEDLEDVEAYDGIWACSSILHCHRDDLADVMHRMCRALKRNGIIYTSFKYSTDSFEGMRNGRYFIDFNEDSFHDFMKQIDGLEVEEEWISADVRPGRQNEKWLNLILRKK